MAQTKQCPRCLQERPVSYFMFWPEYRTAALCKYCREAIARAESDGKRMYFEQVPEKKRYNARREATNALNRGILNRPYCCETCGKECYDLEMHHHNYDKPLSVIFVCLACHRLWTERYYWIDRGVTEKFNIDGSER